MQVRAYYFYGQLFRKMFGLFYLLFKKITSLRLLIFYMFDQPVVREYHIFKVFTFDVSRVTINLTITDNNLIPGIYIIH